jgi:hypothetical protein
MPYQSHSATTLIVTITRKPAPFVHSTTASFAWALTGRVKGVTCKLDTHAATSCAKRKIVYKHLAEGTHHFLLTVRGSVVSRKVKVAWAVDLTPPTAPTSVTGGSAIWTSTPPTLTASGGTDARSGMHGYQYRVSTDGGTTWDTPTLQNPAQIDVPGSDIVQFRSVDNAGNVSAWAPASPGPASTVMLDRTDPAVPVVSGGSAVWQNVASVDVSASGTSDAGGSGWDHYGYRVSVDGGASWSAEVVGGPYTVSAEGTTLVKFRSYDLAGNTSAWVTATVSIDRAAPTDPVVAGGSASWQNVDSVHVSASGSTDSGSGVAGYQRETSTDGGTVWSAPVTAAGLTVPAEGETLVRFRAIDVSGQTSNWVSATVRIDRTDPAAPTLSGALAGWQNVAQETVTPSSTDTGGSAVASYEYGTSTGAGWSAPTTAANAAISAEGTTSVRFRAVDGAGNLSAWTSTTVMIDRTAPTAPTVSGGSSSWQNVTSIALTAAGSTDTGSGLAGYQRQLSTDGGVTWSATTSSSSRTVTAEGETLARFRAIDVSGLTSNWVTGTARIDRTTPTAPSLSGALAGWQNVAQETVTPSSADAGGSAIAGYQYETNTGGAWSAPTTTANAAISAEGTTNVRFRAVDGAGNLSAWTSTTVMIDRTAPTAPTVSGGSASWQSVASVGVSASASTDAGSGLAGYSYETSTDNGTTWSAPTAGASVSILAEGQTLVRFRAVDGVGIPSSWVQVTVRIDRTAPGAPNVSGGSLSWQNVASVTITGSGSTDSGGSALAGYQVRTSTDGVTWSAAAAGNSATVSSEGATYVQVRALDNAGNASAWTPAVNGANNTVEIDRTDPTAPVLSGGSATWTSVSPVMITASGGTDAGSGVAHYEYQVSTNGGAYSPATPTVGPTASISTAGDSVVRFRTVDNVGRVSAWVTAQARIDQSAPSAPNVSGGSLSWQNVVQIVISASGSTDPANGSGLSGYQYRTSTNGGTSWSAAVAGSSFAVTAQGTTLVQFRSVDNAGNTSAWTQSSAGAGNTAKIDSVAPTAPTVTGGSGAGTCYHKRTASASGSTDASSGVNRYEYRYSADNGVTWTAAVTGSSFQFSTRGTYIIQFRAVDNVALMSAWAPPTADTANTVCIR